MQSLAHGTQYPAHHAMLDPNEAVLDPAHQAMLDTAHLAMLDPNEAVQDPAHHDMLDPNEAGQVLALIVDPVTGRDHTHPVVPITFVVVPDQMALVVDPDHVPLHADDDDPARPAADPSVLSEHNRYDRLHMRRPADPTVVETTILRLIHPCRTRRDRLITQCLWAQSDSSIGDYLDPSRYGVSAMRDGTPHPHR